MDTMKNAFIKWFMKINAFFIRISRGRVGTQLGSQNILVLNTVGRKSGQMRSIPIAYFFHEGKYLIVESNWGKDNHADWYFNLQSQPQATLEVKGKTISSRAWFAEREEYARLWDYQKKKHPPYLEYQKMTKRKIPIAIFEEIS